MEEKDKAMIKSLKETEVGQWLVDYLRRECSKICDCRNWGPMESWQSAMRASEHLEEIIDRITEKERPVPSNPKNFL